MAHVEKAQLLLPLSFPNETVWYAVDRAPGQTDAEYEEQRTSVVPHDGLGTVSDERLKNALRAQHEARVRGDRFAVVVFANHKHEFVNAVQVPIGPLRLMRPEPEETKWDIPGQQMFDLHQGTSRRFFSRLFAAVKNEHH